MLSNNTNSKKQGIIHQVNFVDEMKKSYTDYAKHIIHYRSIASVLDGQKKVQRRILYTMYINKFTYENRFIKSARIVGNTSGTLHPHGESSIYESLVRYVQPFTIYVPLIKGQGNYGSIDGDSAAAQRYTEAKLSKVSTMILSDLKYNTVPMIDNYDITMKEPEYLPVKLPLAIINGSNGIAVGFISHIPPHNTSEVINACIYMLENDRQKIDYLSIRKYIKGPDFPVECVIDSSQLDIIYTTGKGNLTTSSIISHKDDKIIIKGIPGYVKKMTMIKSIANSFKEGQIKGIMDIRDESKDNKYIIEIKVSKDTHIESTINRIQKYTMTNNTVPCEFRMTKKDTNKIYTLIEILQEFIDMRINVIKNRIIHQNKNLTLQIEKNIALFIANCTNETSNIINKIINSMSIEDCRNKLKEFKFDISNISDIIPTYMQNIKLSEFKLTNMQIEFLLSTTLSKINKERISNIHDSIKTTCEKIQDNDIILNNEQEIKKIIIEELKEILNTIPKNRVCQIKKLDKKIHQTKLYPCIDLISVVYHDGTIDLKNIDNYKIQKRGGKGKQVSTGNIRSIINVSSHDDVIIYTKLGLIYQINIFDLFYENKCLNSILKIKDGDQIIHIQKQKSN